MVESLEKAFPSFDTDNQETKKSGSLTTPAKRLKRSELSLDINDILALDLEVGTLESKDQKKGSAPPEKVRCCPTLIGCENFSAGYRHLIPPRTCSALHCRNCDFSVSCFPNHYWTGVVEYLFLRTNMPNFEKVSEKLRKKDGSVAYACHCVSFSTNKLQHLHEEDLPWFCKGHL